MQNLKIRRMAEGLALAAYRFQAIAQGVDRQSAGHCSMRHAQRFGRLHYTTDPPVVSYCAPPLT